MVITKVMIRGVLRTVVSITNNWEDGVILYSVIEHPLYDELMELAEEISKLNALWWEATTETTLMFEHELEEKIEQEWKKLMPTDWDDYSCYEEAFWAVVNLATGQGEAEAN